MATTPLSEQYKDTTDIIGYFGMGNFGGLQILAVEHGIDDKLITCFDWGKGREMIRRNTIYTTAKGRQYIRKAGDRYYLDEMMRVF